MRPEKTKEDQLHGDRYEHPAFGNVQVSRVSGGSMTLFQSAIKHQHYIELRISRADLTRNLSSDWTHGTEELIEVAMSEAQWATLVSSLNMGGGVPCTLQRAPGPGVQIERLPALESDPVKQSFEEEMSEHVKGLTDRVNSAVKKLDEILAGKTVRKGDVAALKGVLETLAMNVESNTPFIQKQFASTMEKTTEAAKSEIDGFILRRMQGLGLEALIEQARAEGPLLIEEDDNEHS